VTNVLITGAAGGIGLATVHRFLTSGCKVFAADMSEERLGELRCRFAEPVGQGVLVPVRLDVSSQNDIERALAIIRSEAADIGILINCAGIFQIAPFLQVNDEQFMAVLNVNLLGAFRMAQAIARDMAQRKRGRIINVGSIAGLKGAPGAAHYAASKGALRALSATMAVELAAHNIQVNLVTPGYVDTPMLGGSSNALRALATWRVPMKRLASPDDVAEVICMLATLDTPYVTGTEIVVDGGYLGA
jgi:NAD(P)-dependent dehydrogenase (short-subunit alcohol dehydrogenase family)